MTNKWNHLFLLLAGAFYALGYPTKYFESLFITPIIAYIILFYQIHSVKSLKQGLFKILLFCISFNLTGFYWISHTMTEFGNLPYIVSLLISLIFSLIVLPHLWITFFCYFKFKEKLKGVYWNVFSLSLIFTFIEYVFPYQFPTFFGQPWMLFNKYLGLASILGLPFYSFISYSLVFIGLKWILNKKVNYFEIVITSVLILISFLVPMPEGRVKQDLNIRIAQANIGNYLKISSEKGDYRSVQEVLDYYRQVSLAPQSEFKPNLIIWPETAYPYSMKSKNLYKFPELTPQILKEITSRTGAFLFTGGYDNVSEQMFTDFEEDSNSAFLFSPSSKLTEVYHKRILIPFGESLPFGVFNKYLSQFFREIAFFKRGNKFTRFQLDNDLSFISPICYEILRPEFIRDYLNSNNQTDFIINLTNDSWYGDTSEPLQHLFLAKWRALEFNIPIVRSTNSGITSIVHSNGEESKRLGVFTRNKLDLTLSVKERSPTFYQKYGFLGLLLLGLILSFFTFVFQKRK